jgi:ESCRT-II complex subunit VPS36
MFSSRLAALLKMNGPRKLMEIATEEKISVALALELVDAVEQDGNICRDDASNAITGEAGVSFNEVLYYENVFRDYQWDGQDD